jgi:hypothetical protein
MDQTSVYRPPSFRAMMEVSASLFECGFGFLMKTEARIRQMTPDRCECFARVAERPREVAVALEWRSGSAIRDVQRFERQGQSFLAADRFRFWRGFALK